MKLISNRRNEQLLKESISNWNRSVVIYKQTIRFKIVASIPIIFCRGFGQIGKGKWILCLSLATVCFDSFLYSLTKFGLKFYKILFLSSKTQLIILTRLDNLRVILYNKLQVLCVWNQFICMCYSIVYNSV